MPGFMLHVGAVILCPHAGNATPLAPSPRVLVSGQPVVTVASPYAIAGCTFPAMSSGAPPCVTAQFTTPAARVQVLGQPVLVQSSQATTVPNGTPVIITVTQVRASAQ